MAVNRRKKGARGEKQAISFFKEWTGMDFKRSPASGGLRGHVIDYTVGDIICVEKNYIFYLTIEVKNYKDINFEKLLYNVHSKILDFWNQAIDDGYRGEKLPILLMRYNGLPKDFFFVAISYMDYKLYVKYGIKFDGAKMLVKNTEGQKLFITTTPNLLKIDWKRFEKVTRKIQKKRWQKNQ